MSESTSVVAQDHVRIGGAAVPCETSLACRSRDNFAILTDASSVGLAVSSRYAFGSGADAVVSVIKFMINREPDFEERLLSPWVCRGSRTSLAVLEHFGRVQDLFIAGGLDCPAIDDVAQVQAILEEHLESLRQPS